MAMFVVDEKDITDTTATIVVESDKSEGGLAYTELRGADCRRLAIKRASEMGLSSPGVNGQIRTYPVDKQGEEVEDLNQMKSVNRFRAEVPITRRIV